MQEFWPLATRCHQIIERLGAASVRLFDASVVNRQHSAGIILQSEAGSRGDGGDADRNDRIGSEYSEWFGTGQTNSHMAPPRQDGASAVFDQQTTDLSGLFPGLDELFHEGFDVTLPIMTDVFDQFVEP